MTEPQDKSNTKESLEELLIPASEEFQKAREEYEAENDSWWNGLSEEEREHAFYAVVKRIHQGDVVDQGSYRYVLYDVFGFDPGMYGAGMSCGYMDIHNLIGAGLDANKSEIKPYRTYKWSDTIDVHLYDNNIIHLEFATQKDLSLTMGRPQEFYESDKEELRGKVFTYDQFVDSYTTKDGKFEYLHSWRGYNIPSHVLESFFNNFELTTREECLTEITKDYRNQKYYVIGSSKMHPEVIDHELVHAHYYLNSEYKKQADQLVGELDVNIKDMLIDKLKGWGYADNVINDEINAYMSTSSQDYIKNRMELEIPKKHQEPFIKLARSILQEKQNG